MFRFYCYTLSISNSNNNNNNNPKNRWEKICDPTKNKKYKAKA